MKRTLYLATLLWCWALLVQAQSQINSTVQVHPGGHMGVYGNLNFNSGYVVTPRSAPGDNIYFTVGATHTGASDVSHVNGYAEEAGHAVFTFPIGNGTSYRWAGIASASTAVNYRAAYFSGNPGSATLPTGAPFATTSRGTGVEAVSTVEYWDIDGSAAASITLSWNAASNLATLAGGNPNQLVIVGWNGSQWVNLGQAGGVSGTLGGSGSVTATNVTPDTYTAYTFGSLALPLVAISSPASSGTATTSPTVSGTATPNSTVTLTGPGNTTLCTTTASASGAYSCAVTLPAGPASVTAVATNAGGTSTPAIASFTVVNPALFDCANTNLASTSFVAGTAQNSTLTLGLNSSAAQSLTVSVSSAGGFASVPSPYVASVTAGQASLSIPVSYDGSGSAGVYSLTVSSPLSGNSCVVSATVYAPTPCTSPVPGPILAGTMSPAVNGTNSFTYVSNTSGSAVRWFIAPSSTASPSSGTGTTTGNITFLKAGGYQVIFEETNTNQPAGCSVPATVQSTLDTYIRPQTAPCASPGSSTVVVAPSSAAIAAGGSATFTLNGGQPYQNVEWQVLPSNGASPATGSGATASVTFSQEGLYRVVFTMTNAGNLTCTPVQKVSSALIAVGQNPCASPSDIVAINATSSSGTAATGTTQTFQATGGVPGQMIWKVYPTTGVSNTTGTGNSASITFTQPGNYVVTFIATNGSLPLGCTKPMTIASNVGIVVFDVPTVGITSPANNGTATTSPTVSGTATPNSTVTITGPSNTTLCTTTASASGTYSCAVTVPVGPNSITAVACAGGNCSTPAVSNFTAVGPPSLTVAQPQPGSTVQPISGTATPNSTVTITGPNNATLCTTTASASGTFSCNVTVNPGVTPITVTACNAGGCVTQPVNVTAVSPPTVGITSPTNNGTATTSPTVSGTATPNSTVTLTGPGNTTLCTTTASASGAYSCAVTLPAGPTSITAVASNAGGMSAPAVTNFTVVGPASLTVAPPQPGPTTQPISGTATPNSTVTLTGPGNTTLCTTTASAAGTFSCNVTVPTGPSNVTVTACNGGGCATQVVSVTGVGAPTVGITSPANNGTATTSPTVSGTATPGSVVTLTGPNNTILCSTTATAAGNYNCAVTLSPGPNSITAVACSAGGCSSPAVSSFTVTGSVQLAVRVFLQGALINSTTSGRMRDDLRSKGVIPTIEPYSAMNYTHIGGGGESITSPSVLSVTGANAIVDWVVVELRDANTPSTIIATRSALVQSDGDIVATDGVSPVTFGSAVVSGPSYYVAVRHRNHLGAMTASALPTSATSALVVDFTSASTPVYQYPVGNPLRTSAPMAMQNGVPALWAGNTSGDSRVIMQGPSNDPDPIFFDVISDPNNTSGFNNYVRNNVYSVSDIDLNGRVIFQGPNNEVDLIFFEVMSHPDNQVNQYVNFIIRQQLP